MQVSDVIPLLNIFLIFFLSFHCSTSSDGFDANWYLYFAFVLSTIPTSSTSPPTLLLIQPFLCLSAYFILTTFLLCLSTFCDRCDSEWFFILSFHFCSLSVSLLTYFFVFPPTHLCHFLPIVNVLISSSGGVRDKCRLNCRVANNCTTLIAILHSVFRNNQIRQNVCVYVWMPVPVGECVRTSLR